MAGLPLDAAGLGQGGAFAVDTLLDLCDEVNTSYERYLYAEPQNETEPGGITADNAALLKPYGSSFHDQICRWE